MIKSALLVAIALCAPVGIARAATSGSSDFVTCTTNNQSETSCIVIPAGDGAFVVKFVATAVSNGHGTPTISAKILLNNDTNPLVEQNVPFSRNGGITVVAAQSLSSGKIYTFKGSSGNQNADATGSGMTVTRAGS